MPCAAIYPFQAPHRGRSSTKHGASLVLYPKAWDYSRYEMEMRFFQNLRINQFTPFIFWNRRLDFLFAVEFTLQR